MTHIPQLPPPQKPNVPETGNILFCCTDTNAELRFTTNNLLARRSRYKRLSLGGCYPCDLIFRNGELMASHHGSQGEAHGPIKGKSENSVGFGVPFVPMKVAQWRMIPRILRTSSCVVQPIEQVHERSLLAELLTSGL